MQEVARKTSETPNRDRPGSTEGTGRPARGLAPVARMWMKALRAKQWIRNLLLFAGMVFTINERWHFFEPRMWELLARASAGFVIFCLLSSAVYLVNDVLDVESDRAHPTKRNRPIASGALSPRTAVATALFLMPVGLVGAYALSPPFALVAAGYVAMQVGYVFVFKHVVLLDAFVVAVGFVMRAVSGVLVIGADISPWLYTVTLFGALFLGLSKRRNELVLLDRDAGKHRKILDEYTPALLDTLVGIVASATIMAYSLYTFTAPKMPANHLMMLTIPFVIFGMFRYLFLSHRKNAGGSPDEVFLTDRPLIITVALWALTAGLILATSR